MEESAFHRVVERSQSLVNKILNNIPEAHKFCVSSKSLTLHPSSESKKLQYMESSLGIPRAPTLKGLSAEFTLEMCLNRISEGLQMYQDLLGALCDRVSTPKKLEELQDDIRDLLVQITQMYELGQFEARVRYEGSGLASRLTGDFEVQVAAHLSLVQLQDFAQDIFRSLRNMAQTKPGLSG
ncbi:hypothetical protein AAFF_G00053370 [Aldrovandia affinis]|uniref:Granulocyte colony-stimulating factor n=1 Tax=Aldrovandia affinis TaxID=143900 RepID=A0AAD7T4U2_9TELE|nr:hypothetical protein AAFF_G00053370 [Aldrovandia affinis]